MTPAPTPAAVAGGNAEIEIYDVTGTDLIGYVLADGGIYVIDDILENPEAASDVEVDDWIYVGPAAGLAERTTLPLTLMGVLR